eukprot:4330082-Amphidinium_carterae.1
MAGKAERTTKKGWKVWPDRRQPKVESGSQRNDPRISDEEESERQEDCREDDLEQASDDHMEEDEAHKWK